MQYFEMIEEGRLTGRISIDDCPEDEQVGEQYVHSGHVFVSSGW